MVIVLFQNHLSDSFLIDNGDRFPPQWQAYEKKWIFSEFTFNSMSNKSLDLRIFSAKHFY